ncbi:MAG: methyltransferase domain-containing protein [Myxococcota bacterium]
MAERDLFEERAADWDQQPLQVQISTQVIGAIRRTVPLGPELTAMDFGAGTGLIGSGIANEVATLHAVDVSEAMLAQLATKAELRGKVQAHCQDILSEPLEVRVDLVVSAMAMHHVRDTRALMKSLFDHLVPGGRIALSDLDAEDGSFHPAGMEGVYHAGFDRAALGELATEAGFIHVEFTDAGALDKNNRTYPIFLMTAVRPA